MNPGSLADRIRRIHPILAVTCLHNCVAVATNAEEPPVVVVVALEGFRQLPTVSRKKKKEVLFVDRRTSSLEIARTGHNKHLPELLVVESGLARMCCWTISPLS